MQNLPKRVWAPRIKLKEAIELGIQWSINARKKNVIAQKSPQLIHTYVLSDTPNLTYFHNISSLFRYAQKDTPETDNMRDSILRLLASCIKSHFFLFHNDLVSHEPYFFVLPSFDDPTHVDIGLIYKIDNQDKVIIACTKDLKLLGTSDKILFHFPVVIGEDSFKWFHFKKWFKLKELSKINDKLENPILAKKEIEEARNSTTEEELKKYGTIIDVPLEIKDDIKPAGILWNIPLKKWYLPLGFDVENVIEYIIHIKRKKYLLASKTTQTTKNFNNKTYVKKTVNVNLDKIEKE